MVHKSKLIQEVVNTINRVLPEHTLENDRVLEDKIRSLTYDLENVIETTKDALKQSKEILEEFKEANLTLNQLEQEGAVRALTYLIGQFTYISDNVKDLVNKDGHDA